MIHGKMRLATDISKYFNTSTHYQNLFSTKLVNEMVDYANKHHMENKLKANHSYLVKRTEYIGQANIPVQKITVLSVTQTCYEIQWENTKTWEEISAFDPRITIVEDLGKREMPVPAPYKPPKDDDWPQIKRPHWPRPYIHPWRIDDPVPYYPHYPEWWRITCR